MIYIPLGMRCSTTIIVRYELGLINVSLPFDWCQMTAESMARWMDKKLTKEFLEDFFKEFVDKKNELGDWFPHETFWDERLITKYLRRSERFDNFLSMDEDKTFFIMCGKPSDLELFYPIIKRRSKGNIKFITVNVGQALDENIQTDLTVELDGTIEDGWSIWDKDVVSKLKTLLDDNTQQK